MNPRNGKAGALASTGPIPKNDPSSVLSGDRDRIKVALLEPDRKQITAFAEAMFRHAADGGFVSLRTFPEGGTKILRDSAVPIDNENGLGFLIEVAEDDARRAANEASPAVFCPPLATFIAKKTAKERDVFEGLALTVECDKNPIAARGLLEQILGPATVVVQSGGQWTDPESGEVQDKLHLHWRLNVPAQKDDRQKLKTAREVAARIVGGDPSNTPICHPIRWPGSWHRKGEPVLCHIISIDATREIDLTAALAALQKAAPAEKTSDKTGNGHDRDPANDWLALISDILSAERYHPATTPLTMKLIAAGMQPGAAVNIVRSLMECTAGPQDERWHSRYSEIPGLVASAQKKIGDSSPTESPSVLILTSAEFVRNYVPPDYLVCCSAGSSIR
jgi:hypothetical protein